MALFNNVAILFSPQTEIDKECDNAVSAQNQYLENEKLSEEFTFKKYKVDTFMTKEPADLDVKSSKYAAEFKTIIGLGLKKYGVNFAGHYTIVSVGMTRWGDNYWVVDRTNGKVYEFPYIGYGLDFKKNSNLLILDSKLLIKKALEEVKNYDGPCSSYGIGAQGILYTDLRPFYFLWEDNKLRLLGPIDIKPHINKFWEEYFK